MSIEFVEPDEAVASSPATEAVGPPRPRAVAGRLLGGTAAVAAALAGIATLVPLYAVLRTAFVVDFDGTSTQTARVPFDAFGHAETVPLNTGTLFSNGGFPESGNNAYGSVLTVSLSDGVSYAPWWLGLAGVLLLVGVWALVRPRSSRPAAVIAALGGILLGSVGAAWLEIRTASADSVPQIRFAARPDAGLWLVTAAGALALVAGLLAAVRPPLRRLLPRRRV